MSMSVGDETFSIVVPTRDRLRPLAVCLAGLSRLDYPTDAFEVIVVDDGGEIPCDSVVASVATRFSVRYVRHAHAGPAAARNEGSTVARHRSLAFIDDDCRPHPGWLEAFSISRRRHLDALLGGRTVNGIPHNRYAAASQMLVDFLYDQAPKRPGLRPFFTSNNISMPRERFEELGGFDPTFPRAAAEDRDLCDRWAARGLVMVFCTDAVVSHEHRLDFRSFLRQHFTYGRGAFRFHRQRARRGAGEVRRMPIGFYLEMLRSPGARHTGLDRAALVALLLLSQVANSGGFLWEWASPESRAGASRITSQSS